MNTFECKVYGANFMKPPRALSSSDVFLYLTFHALSPTRCLAEDIFLGFFCKNCQLRINLLTLAASHFWASNIKCNSSLSTLSLIVTSNAWKTQRFQIKWHEFFWSLFPNCFLFQTNAITMIYPFLRERAQPKVVDLSTHALKKHR